MSDTEIVPVGSAEVLEGDAPPDIGEWYGYP
jgi:hypothetical protein